MHGKGQHQKRIVSNFVPDDRAAPAKKRKRGGATGKEARDEF